MEQKQEMIRCRAVAEAEGLRPVTCVTIEDVEPGAWGVAGEPVTDDNLKKWLHRINSALLDDLNKQQEKFNECYQYSGCFS